MRSSLTAAGATSRYSIDLAGAVSVTYVAATALDELRRGVFSTWRAIDAALTALAASAVSKTLRACRDERWPLGEGSVTLGGDLLLAAQDGVTTYVDADREMAESTRGRDAAAALGPGLFDSEQFDSGLSDPGLFDSGLSDPGLSDSRPFDTARFGAGWTWN